jgi:hypothetical protein
MEYKDARNLLFGLQDAQVRAVKSNKLVTGKGTQARIERCLRLLLTELTGEAPTEEQVLQATYR